jgi:hypothetical protein
MSDGTIEQLNMKRCKLQAKITFHICLHLAITD